MIHLDLVSDRRQNLGQSATHGIRSWRFEGPIATRIAARTKCCLLMMVDHPLTRFGPDLGGGTRDFHESPAVFLIQ